MTRYLAYPRITRGIFAAHEKWQSVWPFSTGRYSFLHVIDLAVAAGRVPPSWIRLPQGFEMWLDASDYVQHEILVHEAWAPEITAIFQEILKPGDFIVDIGANVGYFSLLAATLVGPSGHVIAFEPNPEIFSRLKANIARNGFSIKAYQCACSETEGTISLYVNGTGNSGASSMSQANAAGNTSREVNCIIPDTLIEGQARPKLIKIDVEGAEMLVLRGLRKTLAAHPFLCLEVDDRKLMPMGTNSNEVLEYLSSFGYKTTRVGMDVFAH